MEFTTVHYVILAIFGLIGFAVAGTYPWFTTTVSSVVFACILQYGKELGLPLGFFVASVALLGGSVLGTVALLLYGIDKAADDLSKKI